MADREHPGGPEVRFPAGSLFPEIHTEGDAGVPYTAEGVLPNDGPDDAELPESASGDLATSGRDDQERGETVTGLGPGLVPPRAADEEQEEERS
jgi:hypothetical protein